MSRPDWDDYFMGIAIAVANRADCTRSRVGAVLVRADRSTCGTGYNGVLPGKPGCLEGACPRGQLSYEECPPYTAYDGGPGECIATHAEMNALLFLPDTEQAVTCYVTRKPCRECQIALEFHGVTRIVWPEGEWNA